MKTPIHTIALIDDNAIFRMLFGTMLSSIENIDFVCYENALDALDALHASHNSNAKIPDFLFVDINMPYMSGWEMMDKVLEEEYTFIQECKVFIISSSHLDADIQKIHQYEFIRDYIQKPVNKEKLTEILALP